VCRQSCPERNANGGHLKKSNIYWQSLLHLGKMSGGYFVTTFINNAIPILVLPILTHYLAPEQFANVALFSFYLALSNTITGVAIPTVIAKHFFDSDKEHIAKLIGNSLAIALAFSLATMLAIAISYPFLRNYFDLSLFWLILIPLTSLAYIVFSIGLTVMRNENKKLFFGQHQIGNTAINIAVSLVLVTVFMWGWQGRIWGIIISYFTSALLMYHYLNAHGYISFSISSKLSKSILSIVLPLLPNSFQAVIVSQVGIYFIQFYFSKELLGVYAVGFQVAFAIRLLSSTLALSWTPYLYERLAEKKAIDRLHLARMLLVLFAVMLAGVVFINVFSQVILKIMTSKQYFAAREFIPWFTIGYFFQALYVFLGPLLIKHEKQRYISIVSVVNMIIMIGLNVWLAKALGYMGIAYAFSIVYFLMFMAFAWKAQQVYPLPWLRALKIWKTNIEMV
jgi:O-antigen/teichoic acid export membrane protein